MKDRDDIFCVDGLNAPFWLLSLKSKDPIGRPQDHPQLAPLAFLTLCHLGHIQRLTGELLQQLLEDLAVIEVLFNVLDDDTLHVKFVVDPLDQYLDQLLQSRIFV